MLINYVLIDFENVQPKNLEILSNHPFKVFVFVGANQTRIPIELATAMQSLGTNAEYVIISGNGRNALDFHIAYYMGKLTAEDPKGYYHIISRDTGFDPLINNLKAKKFRVHRERDLAEIPVLQISSATSSDEKITAIVKNLVGRGKSRPRQVKTLKNTINSLFTQKLSERELGTLIGILVDQKYVIINDNNRQ